MTPREQEMSNVAQARMLDAMEWRDDVNRIIVQMSSASRYSPFNQEGIRKHLCKAYRELNVLVCDSTDEFVRSQ